MERKKYVVPSINVIVLDAPAIMIGDSKGVLDSGWAKEHSSDDFSFDEDE